VRHEKFDFIKNLDFVIHVERGDIDTRTRAAFEAQRRCEMGQNNGIRDVHCGERVQSSKLIARFTAHIDSLTPSPIPPPRLTRARKVPPAGYYSRHQTTTYP
jgi:hypothetical protein